MKRLILIPIISLASCGTGASNPACSGPYADSLNRFSAYASQYGHPLQNVCGVKVNVMPLGYGPMGHFAGDCQPGVGPSAPTIWLDSGMANPANPGFDLNLFHELGHCYLGLQDSTATLPNGNPASIMYYKQFSTTIFQANQNYYMCQLFGACR